MEGPERASGNARVVIADSNPTEAARLRNLLESIPDAFAIVDHEWRLTYLNQQAGHLVRLDPAEMLGRNLWEVLPEAAGSGLGTALRRAMEERFPSEVVDFCGSIGAWVALRVFPSAEGITIHARDVSNERQAREAIERQAQLDLRESEERYRRVFEGNPLPAWVYDVESLAFLAVNDAAIRHYGYSLEEFLRMTLRDIRPPEEIPEFERMIAAHPESQVPKISGVFSHWKKDGTVIKVEISSSEILFGGRPAGLVIANDITERLRLERQFLRAQRMESIGTLASGIAHDLNNLLMPIMMGVELLKRGNQGERELRALENIERSAKRGKNLVSQVLSFARGVEVSRVPIKVGDVIRELRLMVESTFPKNVKLAVTVEPDLWSIDADPTQMNQVLLNLFVNARDAMPRGGLLSISARSVEIDTQCARMHRGLRPGRYVRVEVSDQGIGIPADLIDRIFDPFFTTKEFAGGTGLGLSTASAIVKSHGGIIDVSTDLGHGSTFCVYLPARDESAGGAVETPEAKELLRGAGELILLVDDEASIVVITRQTLEAFGYRVLTAKDAAAAMNVFARHRKEIAAVITNIMMPVMDGFALITALRRLEPTLKIIASSGIRDSGIARATSSGVKAFLRKPYPADVLLRTLRRVLDERDDSHAQ
jgi:PAS domain S-box-containing protein